MSAAETIYNLRGILEKELSKLELDRNNGSILLKYYKSRVAEGLSIARIVKCLTTLRLISQTLQKPFDKANKEDLIDLIVKIERRDISEWTKHDYKIILKKFYQWLRDCEDGEYPTEVKWIKPSSNIQSKLTKKHLLTSEEVNRLTNAATNIRDKALILLLMESGRRIGELLTLRIGYVEFDDIGARLLVDGKTGTDFSRIIASSPALAVWLDNHPFREDPNAPVWMSFKSKNGPRQLSYTAARSILKDCANRAGLNKRVYFHLFRHTRATQASTKLNQMQMCAMLGWKLSSKMPSVYVHLSGEDIDEAQSIMNGVQIVKDDKEEFRSRECARCKERNSPNSKFCIKCGTVLDLKTAMHLDEARMKIDQLLNKLTEDPEKLEKLLALIGT